MACVWQGTSERDDVTRQAASRGSLFLLLLSIPLVVFMSTWLAKLMDRYPIILWIGAAVLGKVGGQMMITGPWVHGLLGPPQWAEYASMAFWVLFIIVLAKVLIGRRSARNASVPAAETGTKTV